MSQSRFPYCTEQVKRGDEDRYITALFAPADAREGLMTLYAFNLEVARTRESVSEAMLGEIRLTWWRDAVEGIYQGTPRQGHEIAQALQMAIEHWNLPHDLLNDLIVARGLDLKDRPFKTMEELLSYGQATSSGLMILAALVCASQVPRADLESVTQPAGRAFALTGLLRALPYYATQRRLAIPDDIIATWGVDVEAVFSGRMHDGLRQALDAVLETVFTDLSLARVHAKNCSQAAMPALLPAALCAPILRQMCRPDFDPFKMHTDQSLLRRQGRLLWSVLRGRI